MIQNPKIFTLFMLITFFAHTKTNACCDLSVGDAVADGKSVGDAVRVLNLKDQYFSTAEFNAQLKRCGEKLKTLELSNARLNGSRINDANINDIIKNCPGLQMLYLRDSDITDVGFNEITTKLPNLVLLNCDDCSKLECPCFPETSNLKEVHLDSCSGLTNASLENFKAARYLDSLYLENNLQHIGENELIALEKYFIKNPIWFHRCQVHFRAPEIPQAFWP